MNITLRYFVNILFQYPVNIFQVFCEYSFPSISSKKLATGQSGTVKDLWGHVCQKHFVQFQLFDVPFSFSYCVDDTSEPAVTHAHTLDSFFTPFSHWIGRVLCFFLLHQVPLILFRPCQDVLGKIWLDEEKQISVILLVLMWCLCVLPSFYLGHVLRQPMIKWAVIIL